MTLLGGYLIIVGILFEVIIIAIASKKNKDLPLGFLLIGIAILCSGLIVLTLQAGGTLQLGQ